MKKILNLLRENIIFILILIAIFILSTLKLPFYIEAPGGLINIDNRYVIENSYKSKGSINMTYVSEYDATPLTLLVAALNKNMDIIKKENINNDGEEETNYRGHMMLKEANDNAIIVAYEHASKHVKINNQKLFVTYIYNEAKTNLKVKDEIISIDNIKVNSKEEISNILKNKKLNDKINIQVKNNNKNYTRYAYLLKDNIIGILVSYERILDTKPNIKISYKKDEYGPSGGLMQTLYIYNSITEFDITKGMKISGTGTIDENGNVGEISGIKYKLKGAVKNKADVFLVPSENNYNEALKLKKKYDYNIEIIEIKTFEDAINYLKNKN